MTKVGPLVTGFQNKCCLVVGVQKVELVVKAEIGLNECSMVVFVFVGLRGGGL